MAGRYATALFELALDNNAVDAVKADLERFDAMIGDSFRWLTMRIKSQPGFEIILMEPVAGMMLDEESAAQIRSLVDKGVMGGGVFEADDIYQTYDELKGRGDGFKGPPTVQSWGTATVMMDNSGNWFSLGQDKKAEVA